MKAKVEINEDYSVISVTDVHKELFLTLPDDKKEKALVLVQNYEGECITVTFAQTGLPTKNDFLHLESDAEAMYQVLNGIFIAALLKVLNILYSDNKKGGAC